MSRQGRDEPLPSVMQGRWVDVEDNSLELIVNGSEITCFDQVVKYDYKVVDEADGALTVSLKVDDEANEDTFQRANVTELVLTPEGEFHAYNVKFASQFERAG
jgi:uncharacterized glyoxalase superfamily protein PhnB